MGRSSLASGAGDAAVAFYGVGLDQRLDILRTVKQPVQMHFGDKDAHVPPAAVAMLEEIAKERPNIEVLALRRGRPRVLPAGPEERGIENRLRANAVVSRRVS